MTEKDNKDNIIYAACARSVWQQTTEFIFDGDRIIEIGVGMS